MLLSLCYLLLVCEGSHAEDRTSSSQEAHPLYPPRMYCIVEGRRDTKSKRALASLRDDLADQMSSKRSYRSPVDDLKNVQIDDRTVLYCNSKTSTVRYVQCNRCQSYWSPKDDQSLLLLSLSLV